MIERLQRIATFLAHFRHGIVILSVLFLAIILMSVFELEPASKYELLMPSLALFSIVLACFLLLRQFHRGKVRVFGNAFRLCCAGGEFGFLLY
jgi:hypothetical protein